MLNVSQFIVSYLYKKSWEDQCTSLTPLDGCTVLPRLHSLQQTTLYNSPIEKYLSILMRNVKRIFSHSSPFLSTWDVGHICIVTWPQHA